MRLIRLRIRNIASLKGEHEIDFGEIERGSPLFAITGETGSGKSSILNSIGLALYGEIYKKNLNQVDVVTLGEKEGSIELIFQVKGSFYLADWRARVLKQNGEPYSTPQSPLRNLYKIEGEDFSSPKIIANQTAEQLLNLDFDQYCRCIILNQGEFAKFLNSSFKDRRDILEKLYPGEVLDSLSRELENEKKTLEKAKQEVDIQLDTLRGDKTSGDELKALKETLEKELTTLEKTSKTIEDLNYHYQSLFSYYEKYLQNEKNKETIRSSLALETDKYNIILKSGESITERFEKAKKTQETELPVLETYLKKEETLQNLEEGWLNHKKKFQELERFIEDLQQKITPKESEARDALEKMSDKKTKLHYSLDELKVVRPHFEPLFDLFSESELLQEELKGKKERLTQLETSGKDLKAEVQELAQKLSLIPSDIEKKKNELLGEIEIRKKDEMRSLELKGKVYESKKTISQFAQETERLTNENIVLAESIVPLETTLKLQEIFRAKETCIDHALANRSNECPVCEQSVTLEILKPLREKLSQTDLKSIKIKYDEISKLMQKASSEIELYKTKTTELTTSLSLIESDLNKLNPKPWKEIEEELDQVKQKSWEQEKLAKDLTQKNLELQKFRDQYLKLKNETQGLEKLEQEKKVHLSKISENFTGLVKAINKDSIRDLKIEARTFAEYLELESNQDKIQRELKHLKDRLTEALKERDGYRESEETELKKINQIREELNSALNGKKASHLMALINQEARAAQDAWAKHSEEEKKQGNILRESQGRLGQLEELKKDFDLQFAKELTTVRVLASDSPGELGKLSDLAVDFNSPREIFLSLKDLITGKKDFYKDKTNECRMNFSAAKTRFSEWEKLQDKIFLLELKAKDLNESLSRKLRLFEVLGKDDLRTFVLSLVEENLIQQTNEELQKLCQGRYEIVHQTKSMKMTPEFFILDKFREGGKRKVSTLSGGETFMVSLAMALGLAEMTRGQAEIDSLFIDEGFGTLDQESLEDVLDMLQQIQNRGLMVGVISHIKTLTSAIPVNLILKKKQDGTSSVEVQFN